VAKPSVPEDAETTIVAYGDTPLLQPATILALLERRREDDAAGRPITLVTGLLDDPQDLGRIARAADGAVREIVEYRDATPEQRAIREVNSGFCAFRTAWMWEQLPRVTPARNGEIYLTALAEHAVRSGLGAGALLIDQIAETIGVNTRAQQAEAETILRARINQRLLESGVSLQDPATIYVDAAVEVGQDTLICANTHLQGATRIGSGCEIGPNAIVRDSVVGDRCTIVASLVDTSEIDDDGRVGPFAHLRPGTRCGRAVEVGTGSEIKASTLGPGSKMHHFGYLGDATVGANVNVGAGTVTCNFDGERKHATRIGDGAFIGSGTLLVAPVEVGTEALTGAGAVVTKDVAEGTKVVGVPAKPIGARDLSHATVSRGHPSDAPHATLSRGDPSDLPHATLSRGDPRDRQTARKDQTNDRVSSGDDARPTA